MMRRHSADDMAAVIDRFMSTAAHWCLDSVQVASLLGLSTELPRMFDERDLSLAVGCFGRDAERRMRLLVDVSGLLVRLVPEWDDVPRWLRTSSVGYADERVTPLVAMSSGAPAIRALRNYLEELPQPRLAS